MSEHAPEEAMPNLEPEATEPLDFDTLTADIAPPFADPVRPNPRAGRNRLSWVTDPPGDKRDTKRERKPKAKVPNKKGQFVAPLTKMYAGVGAMMLPFDAVCGTAIVTAADECARTLDDLAYTNDAVRRTLWMLTQTSATTAVLVAHAPIIMAVTLHHVPAAQVVAGRAGEIFAANLTNEDDTDTENVE